jgi:hypothetical protein
MFVSIPPANVPAFSANGGSGQFIFNFSRWLGGVADLGAVHNNNMNGFQADTTIANFLLGPRVNPWWPPGTLQTLFSGALGQRVCDKQRADPGNRFNPIIPGQPITARVGTSP